MSTRNATIWIVAAVIMLVLCVQARADLVSYWQFDEGQGDIAYDSIGNNDGTLIGDPCWVTGKIGSYALDFDGVNDSVDIGRPASLLNMGSATVALWFKPNFTIDDTLGRWFSLFENNVAGAGVKGDTFLAFCPYSGYRGRLRLQIITNTGQSFIINSDSDFWPAGDWQHAAISWDNITGAIRMFVNGVEQADKIDNFTGVAMGADRDVTIGSNSEKNRYWWDGVIDEVVVWNRALSAEEIQQLYWEGCAAEFAVIQIEDAIAQKHQMLEAIDETLEKEWAAYDALDELLESEKKDYDGLKKGDIVKAGQKIHSAIQHQQQSADALEKSIEKLEDALTALGWEPEPQPEPEPNLVSYWKFDEGQSDIAYDSAGTNDGTIYGAQWTAGKIGGALEYDGVNDSVDIGRPESLMNMGSATVAIWFNPNFTIDDTLGRWFSLFEKNVEGAGVKGDTFLAFCPTSGYKGRLRLHIITNTGQSFIINSDSDFWPAGDWQHAAVSWDNITGAIRMFVNGVEQADKIDDFTGVAMGADRDVTIGSNSERNKYWWDGVIDEVAVWNRALSPEEVQQLYQDGLN